MFLTTEGALAALVLAVLACAAIGAWSLLCLVVRWLFRAAAPRRAPRPASVRRVVVPAGAAPRV